MSQPADTEGTTAFDVAYVAAEQAPYRVGHVLGPLSEIDAFNACNQAAYAALEKACSQAAYAALEGVDLGGEWDRKALADWATTRALFDKLGSEE